MFDTLILVLMFWEFIVNCGTAISLKWFYLSTNGLVICSVATEPNFKEWITTTKVYDTFHESVGFYISDISFEKLIIDWIFNSMSSSSTDLTCSSQVRIAMVGKYTGLSDAYLSVLKVHYSSIIPFFPFSATCIFSTWIS